MKIKRKMVFKSCMIFMLSVCLVACGSPHNTATDQLSEALSTIEQGQLMDMEVFLQKVFQSEVKNLDSMCISDSFVGLEDIKSGFSLTKKGVQVF